MTDYFPLIARAVEGLVTNTGEARRALYERARSALVAQLRSLEPALPEADITKERLALEDAIRKVEADAARKSRAEVREPRAAAPPPPRERSISPADIGRSEPRRNVPQSPRPATTTGADAPPPDAPLQSARERLLGARTSSRPRESIKGFREVANEVHDLGAATAKSAQAARETRDILWTGCAALLVPDRRSPSTSRARFRAGSGSRRIRRSLMRSRTAANCSPSSNTRALGRHYPRGISRMPRQEMTSIMSRAHTVV